MQYAVVHHANTLVAPESIPSPQRTALNKTRTCALEGWDQISMPTHDQPLTRLHFFKVTGLDGAAFHVSCRVETRQPATNRCHRSGDCPFVQLSCHRVPAARCDRLCSYQSPEVEHQMSEHLFEVGRRATLASRHAVRVSPKTTARKSRLDQGKCDDDASLSFVRCIRI